MADKSIFELNLQTTFAPNDRLVVGNYANSDAEAITGQQLTALLAVALDGHGGIANIAKTSSSGTNPVIDVYTVTYADATTTTFTVTNGLKGDTGAQTYVWLRWAHTQPTRWSDTTSAPDDWMGIYTGLSSTQPTSVSSYAWYEVKGEKGDTGDAASIVSTAVEYQTSTSGTVIPTGTWTTTVPTVPQGGYLWTRTTLAFNSGSPIVSYAVSYAGIDGQGSPSSATPQMDNGNGFAGTGTAFSRDDHIHPTDTTRAAVSDLATLEPKKLTFTNVAVQTSAFVADSTYTDYGFKATVPLTGVTSAMIPEVVFGIADAASGIFAPACETYNGGIYLYASEVPSASITIPTILCWSGTA